MNPGFWISVFFPLFQTANQISLNFSDNKLDPRLFFFKMVDGTPDWWTPNSIPYIHKFVVSK